MKTKYFNDAIIGNKNIKATYSKKGELLRLYYPNIDFRQFIDEFMVGVKVNDSNLIKLYDDINNVYNQYYTENTNILNTEIQNTYFNLKILQTDFVPIKENILVKKYKFINEHNIDLDVKFLIHSTFLTNENNNVGGIFKDDVLMQYMHDYSLCIFSKNKVLSYQINNSKENINEGVIGGKDYVGLSSDSSISYDIGNLKPGETKEIEIIISVYDNKNILLKNIEEDIIRIKKIDIKKEFENTKRYWINYVKKHDTLKLNIPQNERQKKIEKIYKRTILLYPLLTNNETGGISAAAEVDETYSNCGRYSYCWPRDSIFITDAMYKLGMKKEVEKFYKNFCTITQNRDGMWEQRFYTDGVLAPCWGYQIDETSAVVYGVYNYYKNEKDAKFLKDTLKMCEKAVGFLEKYVQDILENKEIKPSYDIWENFEGIHTYSIASIFAAFEAMIKIYEEVKPQYENNRLKLEQIAKEKEKLEKYLLKIKEYIIEKFYDKEKKYFVRNNLDTKMDISLLGIVTPFNIFSPKEKKIQNTVEKINLTLRTYTGGYLRYEEDSFMGGKNPWVIANLWLAKYYIELGEKTKARECFNFVVNSSNQHGFLPEQVNNQTMDAAWVIGLGWSHAMFIDVLEKLI